MLFTVTYSQNTDDLISFTSNSRLEVYGHYIDYCQRAATLAAMVPGSIALIQLYNHEQKIMEMNINSTNLKP